MKPSLRATILITGLTCLLFPAGIAQAQVDLTDTTSMGTEKLRISVKSGPSISTENAVIVDVDGTNVASVETADISVVGNVDDSMKKPLFTITNFASIEGDLEALIDDADPSLAPSTVVIDQASVKVKLSAKEKGDLELKLAIGFPFSVNGTLAGKYASKIAAAERRPPPCAGNSYIGTEQLKASIKGKGGKFNNSIGMLTLSAEDVPFDGMVDFTYVNPSSSPNTTFTGTIDFTGKKPVLMLDSGSAAALEQNFHQLIFDLTGISVDVSLGVTKTSFACGKDGGSLQFGFSSVGTVAIGPQTAPAAVSIGNKMIAN